MLCNRLGAISDGRRRAPERDLRTKTTATSATVNRYIVADGQVIDRVDGLAENVPHSGKYAVPIDFNNAAGNHVIVKIAAHRFVLYAHMRPGTVQMKVGVKSASARLLAVSVTRAARSSLICTCTLMINRRSSPAIACPMNSPKATRVGQWKPTSAR